MTVLLSSHLLTEVEEVCNRVAIVRSGTIVYEGAIADFKRGAGTTYRLETTDNDRALAVCRAQPGINDVRRSHDKITFSAEESAVARSLAGAGRGRRANPGAGAADGHARGSVLLADRGRRRATGAVRTNCGTPRTAAPAEAEARR